MARQIIDRGTTGNDGTGDDLYTGAGKINDNFEEVYGDIAELQTIIGDESASLLGVKLYESDGEGYVVFEGSTADSHETSLGAIDPTADRVINLPDSDGTVALKHNIDSAESRIYDTIDSDYVQERTREANIDFINLKNYTVATAPTSTAEHGQMIFVTDGASGSPCLAVYDSDQGNFHRIALGSYINT